MASLRGEPLSILPKFVVLRSRQNGKYLQYVPAEGSGGQRSLLEFSGEDRASPYSKFEVEFHSAKAEEGYINLRCSYNNKYWSRWKDGDRDNIIAGDAAGPQTDTSKPFCTLFKSFLCKTEHTVRLWHVQLGRYLCTAPSQSSDAPGHFLLAAESEQPKQDHSDVFEYLDWESIVELPRNVAFKGDNGKYLRAKPLRKHDHWWLPDDLDPKYPYLQFSGEDLAEEVSWHEVVPNPDGTIRIRSHHFNNFWRTQADNGYGGTRWIWADNGDYVDKYSSYRVVKLENNVIALQTCAPDGHYCKRLTADGKTDCLSPMAAIGSASKPHIESYAHLTVEEPVISRHIYDVVYREQDARIYNEFPAVMHTAPLSNHTPEPLPMKVPLGGEDTTTTSWKSSSFWSESTSFSVDFKVAKIPFFDGGNITYSTEHEEKKEWATAKVFRRAASVEPEIIVPAMTTIEAKLVATEATCDIPFSFTCRDFLPGAAEPVTYRRDDGLATVVRRFTKVDVDVVP